MNNEKQSSSSAFVQYVINRCSNDKDTGFRAVMRRADNPNQCSAAWEYLVPFCDLASAHQRLSFALSARPLRAKNRSTTEPTESVKLFSNSAMEIKMQRNGKEPACAV